MESIDTDPLGHPMLILMEAAGGGLDIGVISGILVILLLLACSALISGAEIAFFSLGTDHTSQLKLQETKSDRVVMHLLEMPKRLLATILISNNFINVAIVIISTYITSSLVDFQETPYWVAFLVQVVVVTALILLLGEILPKVYATRQPLRIARFMAGPMRFLLSAFYPLSSILVSSTGMVDRMITRKAYSVSMSELSDAIEITTAGNTPEEEMKILQGIARFGDIEVKEIMKSRVDVTSVDITETFPDLLKLVIDAGYSRVPVYEDSFDQVRGILYIKDLLPHLEKDEHFDWRSLLREAYFIPENKKINDLLEEFQSKKIHMAIVVDEYGGTSGIVTLEDIIEEIVGEISDEHDEPVGEIEYSRLDEHNLLFEGKTSLNDFCKIMEIEDDVFDEVKGDADSIAGLLLELMEKIPEKDEKVSFLNFTFTVKAVDKRRIKRVLVTLAPSEQGSNRRKAD